MKSIDSVDPRYRAIELRSLALLCNEWSEGAYLGKLSDVDWKKRLNDFRDAVIASKGKRQPVPSEILQADRDVLVEILKCLDADTTWRNGSHLPEIHLTRGQGNQRTEICFPAPFSADMRAQAARGLLDRRSSPASTAKALLRARYKIPPSTVRDALKKRPETKLSAIQCLGVHFYSTLTIADKRFDDQIRLLDALARATAKPIVLYYLVQHAQRVPRSQIPCPPPEAVAALVTLMPPSACSFAALPRH